MTLREASLESPVEQKVAWARHVLDRRKPLLLGDEGIAEALSVLEQAIFRSREALARAGIAEICRACETHEGGSCCGAGIEKHFGPILLLVNLLLGARIPRTRHDPSSCFFLAENGCALLARHVICVNFLCRKITAHVPQSKIAALREKEGAELKCLFVLEERIKKRLT